MAKAPAILAAILLTASLAIAVLSGPTRPTDQPTTPRTSSPTALNDEPAPPAETLATFRRSADAPRNLPDLDHSADTFTGTPPATLRAARPDRTTGDPAANRDDAADRNPRSSVNRRDTRNRQQDRDDLYQRRLEEERRREREARVRDEQRRADRPAPNAAPFAPNTPANPGVDRPRRPDNDRQREDRSDNTDNDNNQSEFDDLIPDTIPEELRQRIRDLLRNPDTTPSDDQGGGGALPDNDDDPGTDDGDPGDDNDDGGQDTDGQPGDNDSDGDDDGGSSTDGDDPTDDTLSNITPTVAEALWLPVDNTPCPTATNQGLVTNDLYIRLSGPGRVTIIDSGADSTGIQIVGGTPFNQPNGPDQTPSQSTVDQKPCAAFDTFVTLNDADITPVTQPLLSIADDGTLRSVFLIFPTDPVDAGRAVQDPPQLPDPGSYVRIARVTTSPDTQTVRGEIIVGVSAETTTDYITETVTIPDTPTLWGDAPSGDDDNDGGPDDPPDDDDDGDGDGGNGGGSDDDDDGQDDGPDDGDDDTGGGDGGDGGGSDDDGGDTDPTGPTLVFQTVNPNLTCDDPLDPGFTNLNVVDLFVRFNQANSVTLLATGDADTPPLAFNNGTPAQHPAGNNFPPNPAAFATAPCLEFDSYIAIGNTNPSSILTIAPPDEDDWGASVSSIWFRLPPGALAQQSPDDFAGDTGFFVRIARLALPADATVSGAVAVVYTEFGTGEQQSITLDVPPLP